jgi:hypothetical protein
MNARCRIAALLLAGLSFAAAADDRDDYNRRSTERFVAMFHAADSDGSHTVTRAEAAGTIELEFRFDDIDISRDGIITLEELQRFTDASFH